MSFYRNKKEGSTFIVIESDSIVIVANKKTRSKNSSYSLFLTTAQPQ